MVDTKISAMTAATDLVSADIPIVQGAANKRAASSLFGGITLLDTLTTTSGTTQTSSTIAAGYKQLYIEFEGVSFTATGVIMKLALSSTNGAAYGTARDIAVSLGSPASNTISGAITVYNISSTVAAAKSAISVSATGAGAGTVTSALLATNTAAAVDKIQFSGGTFDAGTIRIYGVK